MDKVLKILSIILPLIPSLIEQAEEAFTGSKQGKIKKEFVLSILSVTLAGLSEFKETVEEYKTLILAVASRVIDFTVGIYNVTSYWGTKAKSDLQTGDVIKF